MFRNLFGSGERGERPAPFYRPYKERTADFLYNLLFCDNPGLFRNDKQDASPLAKVLSDAPSVETLEKIAADPAVESRVRILAFNRLRAMKLPVPPKQLLGTVIEFPQDNGLDTWQRSRTGGCVISTKRENRRYSRARHAKSFPRQTS